MFRHSVSNQYAFDVSPIRSTPILASVQNLFIDTHLVDVEQTPFAL